MRYFLLVTAIVLAGLAAGAAAQPAHAVDVFQPCGNNTTAVCKGAADKLFGAGGIWNTVLNVLTFAIGAVSVIMIIVGALRYTLSAGESSAVAAAKNTILYAAIGLVLASLSNAIVNFVLTNV